jgi:hypothetical protein
MPKKEEKQPWQVRYRWLDGPKGTVSFTTRDSAKTQMLIMASSAFHRGVTVELGCSHRDDADNIVEPPVACQTCRFPMYSEDGCYNCVPNTVHARALMPLEVSHDGDDKDGYYATVRGQRTAHNQSRVIVYYDQTDGDLIVEIEHEVDDEIERKTGLTVRWFDAVLYQSPR